MNICHPIFDRQLIYDSFATRPGKGTHSAVRRLRDRVGGYRYYAKLDFRKFFDSIDHAALCGRLRRIIKDKRLLQLLDRILPTVLTSVAPGATPTRTTSALRTATTTTTRQATRTITSGSGWLFSLRLNLEESDQKIRKYDR